MSHAGSIRRELLRYADLRRRVDPDASRVMREAAGILGELIPAEGNYADDCSCEDPVLEAIHNAPLDDKPEDGASEIAGECNSIRDMLLEKNASYGNACFDPIRIFAKASPSEQIRVRIDDKLSRIVRGREIGEDTVFDLIGYLVLLRISMRNSAEKSEATDG